MIEHALGEGLTLGLASKEGSETEGFSDWQVCLDHVKRSSGDLFFLANDTSSLIEGVVNTSHSVDRGSDFCQEDGLLESGLTSELTCIVKSSSSWDNLTTTSVDGISMENAINNVDSDTTHVFFAED